MKILYIIHDNKQGGAAISFLELISEMRKANEVFVLTPHKNGFIPEQLEHMGIKHRNAHYFWWFVKLPNNKLLATCKKILYWLAVQLAWIEAKRLAIILRKEKIDIVHTNSSVINFGALIARCLQVPHVWHIREFAQEFGLSPIKNTKDVYSFMNKYSSKLIAISQAIRLEFSKSMDDDKIIMIYNGIDDKFDMNRAVVQVNKDNDVIDFLITGNVCSEKGQADVIRACHELIKRGQQKFHLSVAGEGDSSCLHTLIEEYTLQSYISILGKVNDMVALREKMDVEIVASKWEAFGRVTIEAMKMSMPVIGTDIGGTPELIEDGVTGFLFNYGDYDKLSYHMERFIENPKLINEMGIKAYNSTFGKFTAKDNALSILKLYNTILLNK